VDKSLAPVDEELGDAALSGLGFYDLFEVDGHGSVLSHFSPVLVLTNI
jgi:hypothetical protein